MSPYRTDTMSLEEEIAQLRQIIASTERLLSLAEVRLAVAKGEPGAAAKVSVTTISIDRTRPFNPEEFIGKGWSIAEQDAAALTFSEIDLGKVRFETCLRDGESCVRGEEKLKRLKQAGHIRLDAKVFQTLWKNQHLIPESWKQKTNNKTTCIFFDGTIFRGPSGSRCVLYLYWDDGRWRWYYDWLESAWYSRDPSAVLAST